MPSSTSDTNTSDSNDNDTLIRALKDLSIRDKKLVKSTPHAAPADPSIIVRSWKMNEFKYSVHPSPFPTLARGLFTRWIPDDVDEGAIADKIADKKTDSGDGIGAVGSEEKGGAETAHNHGREGEEAGKYAIVARGYDKFFNIGEVPWNTWNSLEKYTTGPYALTLKSNGCIIFVAALTPTKLVVTSKHSIGSLKEDETSHAQMGEQWLLKHLASKGKTPEDLAARLHTENLTAVAELCDDSFEEHVLGYPPELTGLHLHGLNRNQGAFDTLPTDQVDAFAWEYGFIKTAAIHLQTIAEVRKFTDECGETGEWQGQAVEGFVVRCTISPDAPIPNDKRGRGKPSNGDPYPPPYPPGSSFFFKIKFDEPYLMYRGWREITRTLVAHRLAPNRPKPNIPRSRLVRPETRVYKDWAEREMDKDLAAFEGFTKGKGIIATRERFLHWLDTEEGQKALDEAKGAKVESGPPRQGDSIEPSTSKGKTVIVPIAIPGCGKTTVALSLSRIFGFAHTQSDDITAKKPAPIFCRKVAELFKTNNVVIADRNNHLAKHRTEIRAAADKSQEGTSTPPPVRIIYLQWPLSQLPISTIHRICGDRVLQRGSNHQSLRADETARTYHEDVIWQFATQTEELGEDEVVAKSGDAVVEMRVEENEEQALRRAVDGIVRVFGVSRPSEGDIKAALDATKAYKVTVKKDAGKAKAPKTGYYGFLAEIDLNAIVGTQLNAADEHDADVQHARKFWDMLTAEKRVAPRPHITLVHSKSLPDEQEFWDRCTALYEGTAKAPLFEFSLGKVICDDRVMVVIVDDIGLTGPHAEAQTFLDELPTDLRKRMHITVGTRDKGVPNVEGGILVVKWKDGEAELGKDVHIVDLQKGTKAVGRIRGLN